MTRRHLPPCRPGFTDYVFKTKHGVALPLRLWPAPRNSDDPSGVSDGAEASEQKPGRTPWLLWIHGGELTPTPCVALLTRVCGSIDILGGFTAGKWSAPTAWVSRAFADRGYAVVSVGYRQMPQVSLSEMIDDCVDAVAWCRDHLPSLADVDIDAWAVGGSSGGATLAALVAHRTTPRALIDVYGMVNGADWYHHDPHRRVKVEPYYVADEEELADALEDRDPRNAVTQSPWAYEMPPAVPLAECRAALGMPDFVPKREHFARNDLYSFSAKYRTVMPVIFRKESFRTEREYWDNVINLSAYHLLDRAQTYPATFLMHGTSDRWVRVEQSWEFESKLKLLGVPVAGVYPEGRDHMFDFDLVTPEDEGWDEIIEPCMDFVDRHVKISGPSPRWVTSSV